MARQLSPERKEFINGLLQHYQPERAQDVQVCGFQQFHPSKLKNWLDLLAET